MKTTKKVLIKDIKKLNLKGIEILEAQEKSSDDLLLLRLRDSVTGVEITVQQSSCFDFYIAADVPPKTEKQWKVTGKLNGFAFEQTGPSQRDLERDAKALGSVTELEFTEVEVPVE